MSHGSRVEHLPDTVAGYRVLRRLGESSLLCLGPGDRQVVLKPLDEDCLLKGQLHPSIRERLARVRELAHAGVVNLYSVERENSGVWLVWEYAEGGTLEEWVAGGSVTRDVWEIARELVLAIEALHARGIVHGSVHERNVIVDRLRQVRLTHVSPLLYTETTDDASAAIDMLERLGAAANPQLARAAREARPTAQPLREVRARLAGLIQSRDVTPHKAADENGPDHRYRTLAAAVLIALAAVAISLGLKRASTPVQNQVADQPIVRK